MRLVPFGFSDDSVKTAPEVIAEWRSAAPLMAMALAEIGYTPGTVLSGTDGAVQIDADRADRSLSAQARDFARAADVAGAPLVARLFRTFEQSALHAEERAS